MRAQRRVHFSLVAHHKRFYNIVLHVRPHTGDVRRVFRSLHRARDTAVTLGSLATCPNLEADRYEPYSGLQ
jgi:hypothetical protein